ncbi:MAG TPA: tetraacyldisaccharide 4'-kinase [Casimicrobiaceae bacterium]|nr:tetraacyldisaccharide 4'-kinase [Casimicrobiaceae bacterium]
MNLSDRLTGAWYAPALTPITLALLPLSLLFGATSALRRLVYRTGIASSAALPVPVIVVGNIAVAGSGKTPLTRALAEALSARGWRPGILSRGYGGVEAGPRAVAIDDDPRQVGDEPPLLAASGFPVWIGRDRAAAARALLAVHPECDVLVSDDGLQHYALRRNFEIAAIDGARGFGNGWLLPAGPLREPRSRLREVDAVVTLVASASQDSSGDGRETKMWHEPLPWRNIVDANAIADLSRWRTGELHAIAGIANPQRFFDLVKSFGLDPVCHVFPDHHRYGREEIDFPRATAILMTEKDAVKCMTLADARCWYLPIRARIDPALVDRVERKLRGRQAA